MKGVLSKQRRRSHSGPLGQAMFTVLTLICSPDCASLSYPYKCIKSIGFLNIYSPMSACSCKHYSWSCLSFRFLPLISSSFAFRCENPKCIGNPKTKELPALAAPTIASVFKERYDQIVRESNPTGYRNQHLIEPSLVKRQSSSQKSLDALNQEVKNILKEAASKLQPSPTEDREMMTSEPDTTKST